jgi:hypothetical protein
MALVAVIVTRQVTEAAREKAMNTNKQYPDIHSRLLELGFTVYSVRHNPGETRWVYYRLEGKAWSLVWSINPSGEFWKAEYLTAYPDSYIYRSASDAIDKSDKHIGIPVAEWRKELAANIRICEPNSEQMGLL